MITGGGCPEAGGVDAGADAFTRGATAGGAGSGGSTGSIGGDSIIGGSGIA
jgi:hypothetical protein